MHMKTVTMNLFLFLFVHCCSIVLCFVSQDDLCPVKSFDSAERPVEIVSSSNKFEEYWMKFGPDFRKLIVQLEVQNLLSLSPPYSLDTELVITEESIFKNEENKTRDEWLSVIVELFKMTSIGKDKIKLRVIINKKINELDTKLWWRVYRVEKFHILGLGKVDLAEGCLPSQALYGSYNNTSASSTLSSVPSSYILVIVLGTILILIIIASTFLIILYINKKKRRMAEEEEEHRYQSIGETFWCKDDTINFQQDGPPPVPDPPFPFTAERGRVSMSPRLENVSYTTHTPAQNSDSSNEPEPQCGTMVSNMLYNYDIPQRQLKNCKEREENQYVDMSRDEMNDLGK